MCDCVPHFIASLKEKFLNSFSFLSVARLRVISSLSHFSVASRFPKTEGFDAELYSRLR